MKEQEEIVIIHEKPLEEENAEEDKSAKDAEGTQKISKTKGVT